MITRLVSLVSVAALLVALTDAILTPSTRNSCFEQNQKLICSCLYNTQVLDVPVFNLPNMHSNIAGIVIENCSQVKIGSNAIRNLTSLRHFEIKNVKTLVLSESSLSWSGYLDSHYNSLNLRITITDTNIPNLPQLAVQGKISELKMINVTVDQMQSFAFASITRLKEIEIRRCVFKRIDSQAFKKIETEKLIISDSEFLGVLPSRAFTDIDVTEEFKIVSSRFGTVNSIAFNIKLPQRVNIISSTFDNLNAESFIISAKGSVVIKNNNFKQIHERAFIGITLIKEHRAQMPHELQFDGNTFTDIKKQSLSFNRTSFTPKFGQIKVNLTCTCINIEIWITNNEWKEHIHCIKDAKTMTTIKAMDFKTQSCDSGSKLWIILVCVFSALLVLLIIAAVVIVLFYRRYKARKQMEYVNRGNTKNGSLGMIVPDGRTYRETEVHVIVEKAELLTTEL